MYKGFLLQAYLLKTSQVESLLHVLQYILVARNDRSQFVSLMSSFFSSFFSISVTLRLMSKGMKTMTPETGNSLFVFF